MLHNVLNVEMREALEDGGKEVSNTNLKFKTRNVVKHNTVLKPSTVQSINLKFEHVQYDDDEVLKALVELDQCKAVPQWALAMNWFQKPVQVETIMKT